MNQLKMTVPVFLCFILAVALIQTPVNAIADYNGRIPNGSEFGCNNCHFSGDHFLNDFASAGNTWTAALAAMDSDSDGYTNGAELQDPTGAWSQGQPDPGSPGDVTNPADTSSHPSDPTATPAAPTATPAGPTATPAMPTATPSPTSPPGNTPTPAPCTSTGVTIEMPAAYFTAGDPFYCQAVVCNAETGELTGYPLFVILDIMGTYYFAPGFSAFEYYTQTFPMGDTTIDVLSEFAWPQGAGTFSGAMFYGALTDPDITSLFGTLGTVTFGWGN